MCSADHATRRPYVQSESSLAWSQVHSEYPHNLTPNIANLVGAVVVYRGPHSKQI